MEKASNKKQLKKLSTHIKGLDDLFYGGIQLVQNSENHDGMLVLTRGEHGVNKIHLAMQMCEGLYISLKEETLSSSKKDKAKTDAFEGFYPLSSYIDKNFSFDEISVLKMLLIEDAIKIIKEYANKQMEKDEKWKALYEKYVVDAEFVNYCATRYVEETLNNNDKELIKNYWSCHYKIDTHKNKTGIEKILENEVKDYSKSLLRMFVVEKTTNGVLKKFTRRMQDWVKAYGDDNDKKELKKFNKESASHASYIARYIEDTLIRNDDLINQYWKYDETDNIEGDILTKIFDGDENNYKEKLNELNQENKSNTKLNKQTNDEILFISLNKDGESLKSKYYDFYIQRLIRNIRSDNSYSRSSVELLQRMIWYVDESCCECDCLKKGYLSKYGIPSISGSAPSDNQTEIFSRHIQSGFIYYNGRTHGFHLRHQKGAPDTGNMLLCKLFIPENSMVRIIGRDELNNGNRMANGLISFNNLLTVIDNYLLDKNSKKNVDFIMVDGLSRLTQEEIGQCPFNALSDKLRKACKIGIITADEKIQSSEISTDIVIDMAIKERPYPDQLYHALRISKCLYQRNAYGWHSYKMRMAGIEVIPSVHFQIITRYLMDDIVADALLPIDEDPYPFWLNESSIYYDENIKEANFYETNYEKNSEKRIKYNTSKNSLKGVLHFDKRSAMKMIIDDIISKRFNGHNILFIDLNFNRSEFKSKYYDMIDKNNQNNENIHLFTFQPGYIHADEFLWAIDQQVQAISRTNKKEGSPDTHYERTHLIIGDLNYMSFAYPCLNKEGLVLPAIASYTKKHHMTNYVYASVPSGSNIKLLDKETEIIRQMWAVVGTDNMIEVAKSKTTKRKQKKY